MADYLVQFEGHIIEAFRPEGFPKIVKHDVMVRAENLIGVQNAINQETAELYIKRKCFIVPKDPGNIEEVGSVQVDQRMLIPMHMISHISTKTTKLATEVPDEVDMTGENGPKVYQQ
jgi:hypothetical protein